MGIVFEAPKHLLIKAIARCVAAHQALNGHSSEVRPSWESDFRRRVENMDGTTSRALFEDDFPRVLTVEVERSLAIGLIRLHRFFDAAVVHYTAAIELNPNDDVLYSVLYADRAICYIHRHKFSEGLQDLKNAAVATPDDANVQWLMGLCHYGLYDFESAHEAFSRAIANDPSNNSYVISQRWSAADANRQFFVAVLESLNVSMLGSLFDNQN